MIPEGDLLRSRVVTDLAAVLEDALDRRLDGYAVVEPRDALLADTDDSGVVTFEDGVPTLAYHVGSDRGGPPALAAIGAGPYRLELYALDAADLAAAHDSDDLRVPPGMVAERLAGAPDLADRTRRAAGTDHESGRGALDAFLDDEAAIEELRENARAEAEARAEEWDFEDAVPE
jgi:hypothetical protein